MTHTNNNNETPNENDVILMNSSRPNWNTITTNTTTSSNSIDTSIATTIIRERCEWDDNSYQESLRLYNHFMKDDHHSDTDSASGGTRCHQSIQEALACLSTAYRKYGGPHSVVCSFNGGKDAVVLLHLVRAAHAKYYHDQKSQSSSTSSSSSSRNTVVEAKIPVLRPRVIYFDNDDEFIEISSMLHTQVKQYDLDMICFEKGMGYAQGVTLLLHEHQKQQQQPLTTTNTPSSSSSTTTANNESAGDEDDNRNQNMMAFMLGTRKGDPNAGDQNMFALSSWGNMPSFMRVNPIIHWNYGMVWQFLRHYQLPYCPLYDQGYTSLGTTQETLRCPALRIKKTQQQENNANNDDDGTDNQKDDYYPAYMLQEWDQERAGRIKKEKKKNTKENEKTTSSVPIKKNNNDHNNNENTPSKNNQHDASSSSSSSVSGETTASTVTMSSVDTSDAAATATVSSSSSSPTPPSLIYYHE